MIITFLIAAGEVSEKCLYIHYLRGYTKKATWTARVFDRYGRFRFGGRRISGCTKD